MQLPPRASKKPIVAQDSDNEDSQLHDILVSKASLNPPLENEDSEDSLSAAILNKDSEPKPTEYAESGFSFDYNPRLRDHCGPSPCRILQALTMSNANDGRK